MEKVYLVYCIAGSYEDYVKWVEFVCKDEFSAEERKLKIQKEIDTYKMYYFQKTKGKDFYEDCENYIHLSNKHKDLLLEFEYKYPKLKIKSIIIEEMDLI